MYESGVKEGYQGSSENRTKRHGVKEKADNEQRSTPETMNGMMNVSLRGCSVAGGENGLDMGGLVWDCEAL